IVRYSKGGHGDVAVCESAWNKDPVFGVIGIQSAPRGRGSTVASMILGSRGWDADFGNDCEDPSRVFCTRQVDQIDLPRAGSFAEGRAEGDPIGGDRIPLRARGATASEDRPLD